MKFSPEFDADDPHGRDQSVVHDLQRFGACFQRFLGQLVHGVVGAIDQRRRDFLHFRADLREGRDELLALAGLFDIFPDLVSDELVRDVANRRHVRLRLPVSQFGGE